MYYGTSSDWLPGQAEKRSHQFASFVYRLGRWPFTPERGVQLSYGVPNNPLTVYGEKRFRHKSKTMVKRRCKSRKLAINLGCNGNYAGSIPVWSTSENTLGSAGPARGSDARTVLRRRVKCSH